MSKEPTKEDLNKLAKIRSHFGDYIECLQMILTKMVEGGQCIWLNDRIICSEIKDLEESFPFIFNKRNKASDPIHFVTVDEVKWYAIEEQSFFLIYNEDYSKNYYLTIN